MPDTAMRDIGTTWNRTVCVAVWAPALKAALKARTPAKPTTRRLIRIVCSPERAIERGLHCPSMLRFPYQYRTDRAMTSVGWGVLRHHSRPFSDRGVRNPGHLMVSQTRTTTSVLLANVESALMEVKKISADLFGVSRSVSAPETPCRTIAADRRVCATSQSANPTYRYFGSSITTRVPVPGSLSTVSVHSIACASARAMGRPSPAPS